MGLLAGFWRGADRHGDGDVVARRAVILAVILVRTRPFVAFFCVLMGLLLCGGGVHVRAVGEGGAGVCRPS